MVCATVVQASTSVDYVPQHCDHDVTSDIVSRIGDTEFCDAVLHHLHRVLPLGAWTVFRMREGQAPELEMAATFGGKDMPGECWRIYREGLYRSDRSFDRVRQATNSGLIEVCCTPGSAMSREHRKRIYDDHRLQPRMSLAMRPSADEILALNFYRFTEQPAFQAEDMKRLASVGAVLAASVKKHLSLTQPIAHPQEGNSRDAQVKRVFKTNYPRLTQRELEVCAALVAGLTFDGIAAQLQVSPATVKTYRDRAFRLMGIQHRNQLFSLVLQGVEDATSTAHFPTH